MNRTAAPGAPPAPRSAYLHIPFCHRRCFYCDFPVVPLGDRSDGAHSASIATYLVQLRGEIAASPPGPPLSTVYLGGGTPSMLTPHQVEGLLGALRERYGLAPGAEISLELDPASFDRHRLAGYLAAGVNRVSLGGQSFDDAVLSSLGRRHRADDLRQAAGWLRQAHRRGELRSWSLDLIQGLPEPAGSLGPWQEQLRQAIELEPPHLSVYDLIVEPGTVFAWRQERGELALPDQDLGADLMELTWRRLTQAGYGHYEISNYALPGHASRHNRVYWSGAGWWGFGMGATSAPHGRREARPRTRAGYAEWLARRGQEPVAADGRGMPFEDRLLVGLRLREGVNLPAMVAATAPPLSAGALQGLSHRLEPFERQGLLRVEGDRWRLSDPAGLALSNAVLRELLGWWQEEGEQLRSGSGAGT
jgi:oxygen-independent coproporphyrinogen-3 oxidase